MISNLSFLLSLLFLSSVFTTSIDRDPKGSKLRKVLRKRSSSPVGYYMSGARDSYPGWNEQKKSHMHEKPAQSEQQHNDGESDSDEMYLKELSKRDRERLERIYGPDFVQSHKKDFERLHAMTENGKFQGRSNPGVEPVVGLDRELVNNARLSAVETNENEIPENANAETSLAFDVNYSNSLEGLRKHGRETERSTTKASEIAGNCNIHGVWLSSVAGVGIELLPTMRNNQISIQTKTFKLPNQSSKKGILWDGLWTGNGMISPESPTTMTIVFQEQSEPNSSYERELPLPKTAVFVGQCMVCDNSPVLQGTWIVFPTTQSCESRLDTEKTEQNGRQPDVLHRV